MIAATELAKERTGALIVIERDIKLKDIVDRYSNRWGSITTIISKYI